MARPVEPPRGGVGTWPRGRGPSDVPRRASRPRV